MARNGSKKTIFWLIVVLIIVCWIELVMVVKFFTKEYRRYTMEKNNNAAVAYYETITLDEEQEKKEYLSIAQGSESINQGDEKIDVVEIKYDDEITSHTSVEPEMMVMNTVSSSSFTRRSSMPSQDVMKMSVLSSISTDGTVAGERWGSS